MYIWMDDVYTIDGQNCVKIIAFIIDILVILFGSLLKGEQGKATRKLKLC